jgi:8-oxo-dGTP diphosphatase
MYTYKYPRAALTVDAIIVAKEKERSFVLLIERGAEPFKNRWALPGGFVNLDETLETACKRELYEETGLELKKMHQFKAFDEIDRDPRHRTISVVFWAEMNERKHVKGSDDAAFAKWFAVNELPGLAFDHGKILSEFFTEFNP